MRIKSQASVILVESATEAAHFPSAGWKALLSRLSHVKFVSKSEADLRAVIQDLDNSRPSALVMREGAMQLPFVREILTEYEAELQRYMEAGGFFVVLITAINSEDFVFHPNRAIDGAVRVFRRQLKAAGGRATWLSTTAREDSGDDVVAYYTWAKASIEPSLSFRTLASCHFESDGDDANEYVCAEILVGRGRFVVSTIQLPPETEPDIGESIIERLMAHIVREDTFLSMREAGLQERFRRGERGSADTAVMLAEDQHEFERLARYANHLYVTDSWLAEHQEESGELIARLLQNGSVRIVHTNSEPNFESILAGPPDYYLFLESVAMDLRSFVHTLASGPTFNVLAYSFLVAEISSLEILEQWVPDIFRHDYAESIVRGALRVRVENGTVDGHFLASANLYVASRLLRVDDKAVDDLEKWLAKPGDTPNGDFVAQAHFFARLAGVRSDFFALGKESSLLSHIGLLATAYDPMKPEDRKKLNESFSTVTSLEKILTLHILQRNNLPFTPEQSEFMESFFTRRRVETLEAFSYHSALLLRHLVDLPIRPIQQSASSDGLETEKAISERESNLRVGLTALEHKLASTTASAEAEYASLLRVARSAFRFLLVLVTPLQLLVLAAPWIAFSLGWLDVTAALTFTGTAALVLSLLWLYVLGRPEVEKIAPRAIVAVGNFLRGIRKQ